MSGEKLLLDTNIVINYFRGIDTAVSFIKERPDAELYVSVMTRMELLSFHGLTADEEAMFRDFLDTVTVVPLDEEVEHIVIALRRETRRKMPDAIVAATAVHLNALLVTADEQLSKTVFRPLRTVYIAEP